MLQNIMCTKMSSTPVLETVTGMNTLGLLKPAGKQHSADHPKATIHHVQARSQTRPCCSP